MQDYGNRLGGTLCDLLLHQESPQVIWRRNLPSIMHWALLFLMETVTRKAKLHRLRKLFEGCKVLIVDEVSMVGCRMLRDIHSLLCEIIQCQDKPFGGMCVVLMGDFVQLTPVGQTELFGSVKVQFGGQDLNDVFGRELVQKFDEVSLVKQHRATDHNMLHRYPPTVNGPLVLFKHTRNSWIPSWKSP